MPSDTRYNIKFLLQKLMSNYHIFNQVFIDWACLITCNPPSIDKFKSFFFYKLSKYVLSGRVLKIPPPLEEPYLSMSEMLIWIFPQILCNISQYPINSTVKILYGSATPPSILMTMSDYVENLISIYFIVLMRMNIQQSVNKLILCCGSR